MTARPRRSYIKPHTCSINVGRTGFDSFKLEHDFAVSVRGHFELATASTLRVTTGKRVREKEEEEEEWIEQWKEQLEMEEKEEKGGGEEKAFGKRSKRKGVEWGRR